MVEKNDAPVSAKTLAEHSLTRIRKTTQRKGRPCLLKRVQAEIGKANVMLEFGMSYWPYDNRV